MLVTEVVPLEHYGAESRFRIKIPTTRGKPWQKAGDNIYVKGPDSSWSQRRPAYHKSEHMARDLSGVNVLVSDRFWYFGASAPPLPPSLRGIVKDGPGHLIVPPEVVPRLLRWLSRPPAGFRGDPFHGHRARRAKESPLALDSA